MKQSLWLFSLTANVWPCMCQCWHVCLSHSNCALGAQPHMCSLRNEKERTIFQNSTWLFVTNHLHLRRKLLYCWHGCNRSHVMWANSYFWLLTLVSHYSLRQENSEYSSNHLEHLINCMAMPQDTPIRHKQSLWNSIASKTQ